MVQRHNIEVVFDKGKPVVPLGDPFGPTRREQIEMSSERSRIASAEGTEIWEQRNARIRERVESGRVECEVVYGRPAIEATVSPLEF